ncbi:TVP38/TMEM64 family protein [Haloferula chungangensis]|uniref:TVP38/TMEM64 family membrane protein n=1 Tax=Haloferula chungangensis TaxID=1048331 RepID=A0ABW2LCR5_9BACT
MRLLGWFVMVSLVMLGIWLGFGSAWEERFSLSGAVAWLESSGSWAWLAGIGLLVSDVLLPVPGTVVMSALGWIYGPMVGGLFAAMGSICAGLVAYAVCRAMGERVARRILGDLDFDNGRMLFGRGGAWMVALSRALPILPEAIACTAGLVGMPFGRFFGALVCGSVPMGFLFAWIGGEGRDAPGWALGFSLVVPAILWGLARILFFRSKFGDGKKEEIDSPEDR